MNFLGNLKTFVKKLGISHLLEKWIVSTYVGARIYLAFMRISASPKSIDLQLEKSNSNLNIVIGKKNKLIKISMRHFAYLQDVVVNFDYYFNAVQPEILSHDQMWVDYSLPRQHILLPSKTPFFFSSFAEPIETTDIYLQMGKLKEGDIVLDLGSYCGSTVWGFSKAVGESGKVYGFEPDPINFEVFCKNIEYHQLSNVVAINRGVWSFSGNLLFQGEGNMGSGISKVQSRAANLLKVPVISLDDFCEEFDIRKIDYIKIDIEGAEIEVLKASSNILKKYKPRLIIEPHIIGMHLITEDVCNILFEYGYTTEILPQSDLPLPLIYAYPASTE